MQLIRILALVSLSTLPAVAEGKDFTYTARVKAAFAKRLPMRAPKTLAPQCEDFSGTWQGACEEEVETMVIKQEGCYSINIDGQDLPINGTSNKSTVSSFQGSSTQSTTSMTVLWNDAQTRLRILTALNFYGDGFTAGGALNSALWLADGQIHSSAASTGLIDVDGAPVELSGAPECVYSRVTETK